MAWARGRRWILSWWCPDPTLTIRGGRDGAVDALRSSAGRLDLPHGRVALAVAQGAARQAVAELPKQKRDGPLRLGRRDDGHQVERGRPLRDLRTAFEGIIPMLMRRFKETTSESMRKHYLRYFSDKACSGCGGERLRPESRAVRIRREERGRRLAHDHRGRGALHEHAAAGRKRQGGGDRAAQGDRQPAQLPPRRRPLLLNARSAGPHPLGRRVAAHPARLADGVRVDRRDLHPRRAVDRPAPARQRAPALDAAAAARSGQHA